MKPFVVNMGSGVVHDVRHATEQCNLDDMDRWNRAKMNGTELVGVIMAEKRIWTMCEHCWPSELEK